MQELSIPFHASVCLDSLATHAASLKVGFVATWTGKHSSSGISGGFQVVLPNREQH